MARRKVTPPETAGVDVQPTPAAEWRKAREEGEVVTFITGRSARLQAVSLSSLLKQGRIPDTLTPFAAAVIYEGQKPRRFSERWPVEDVKATEKLLDIVVMATWIEPKVVDRSADNGQTLADDEISVDDIDVIEKEETLEFAAQPASTLRQFRRRQARDMATVHDG